MVEIETLADFDAYVNTNRTLRGVALQGLDLTDRTDTLSRVETKGAFLLGCALSPEALAAVNASGACVFPRFIDIPFRAFRSSLYTAEELYSGYEPGDHPSYDQTMDGATYVWHTNVGRTDVVSTLAERVHDHAIDDALQALLDEVGRHRVMAIMGGHSMQRDSPEYRSVAELALAITRSGLYVATGGGPGAMEAANLGAWMSEHPDDALDEALEILSAAPNFVPVGDWLDAGFKVRQRWPRQSEVPSSLGVPTWHYGHEPPNVFGSEIAKYFANSIREEGLLAIAHAGVVFTPGSAGTIQEVFQDAAQNHYESFGMASAMVFMNVNYWTEVKPVYPLLKQLAADKKYGATLTAMDSVDEIVAHLVSHAPADSSS